MKILVCFSVLMIGHVLCYSAGPPLGACGTMTPGHGFQPQSGTAPYQVSFSKNTYKASEVIEVTLSATGGSTFKGFFIQPRKENGVTTYGEIPTKPSNARNPCDGSVTALCHNSPDVKTSVKFNWTSPSSDEGDIKFVYTVVQTKAVYWILQDSSALSFQSTTPTDASTDAPTDAPTDVPPSSQINRDAACEVTKSCFPSRTDCSTNCDFLVTWKSLGSEDVEFSLARKTTETDYWIGVGFSDNPKMGNDSVVACVANNSVVETRVAYNMPTYYANKLLSNSKFGVTSVSQSLSDGILSCTFRRKRNFTLADGALENEAEFFDLSTEWYLLVAHGPAVQGSITKHAEYPKISTKKINFLTLDSGESTPPPDKDMGINRDAACEVTKSCFPSRTDCSTNCDFLVTWKSLGSEDVEFSLARKTTETDYWIGVGFSDNPKMGNDSVVACVANNGDVLPRVAYNTPTYTNQLLSSSNFGVTSVSQSLSDGILSCTFRRKRNFTLADGALGRRRRAAEDEAKFFDLSTEWYLLVAHGPAVQGSITKHAEYPKISTKKINFLTLDSGESTPPRDKDMGTVEKSDECGKTVGCFHDCDASGKCGFLLTWKDEGEDIALSLSCKRGTSSFCAIGLSKDDKMGDDSVFECVENNGEVNIYVSYNPGKSNNRLDEPHFGLSSITTSYNSGVLTCTFKRRTTYAPAATGRKKRATVPSSSTYFDMNSDWNLLHAYGTSIGGFLNKHQTTPLVSSQKADFQSFMDLGGSAGSKTLIKLHGIFMIIAWMVCASIGIFIARFYKPVWPEGTEWCGQKRWFVMHRALMVTTVLLTAAAFIVIFVHVGKWSEIVGSNFQKAHPIIGTVVMALALINPTVAICRPHPGTPKRIYFNIFHSFVGGAAHTCSIVNIFAGTMLSASGVTGNAKYVLWVFVGWIVFVSVMVPIYDCQARKGSREEAYEMNSSESPPGKNPPKKSQFKHVVLYLHILVVVGLSIALCVMVGTEHSHEDDDL